MIVTLHSESFGGMSRDKLRARIAELEARFPGSTIKTRRWPNYGGGYILTVKGEGQPKSIQSRGHCQFCGNHQVVKDGVLVLHGYQRPGNGWIFGRCPGAAEKPLQYDQQITVAALAASQERLDALQKALPRRERAAKRALWAYEQSPENGMAYAMPSEPYSYRATDAEKAEAKKAHEARLAAWYLTHPLTKAYITTRDAQRSLEVTISQVKGGVDHFTLLLSWKLLGTPLVEVAKG